jgi:hypothetical protein
LQSTLSVKPKSHLVYRWKRRLPKQREFEEDISFKILCIRIVG